MLVRRSALSFGAQLLGIHLRSTRAPLRTPPRRQWPQQMINKVRTAVERRMASNQQKDQQQKKSADCKGSDENDIRIRVIEQRECERVLDFLRVHYYREEPLTVGIEPAGQDPADEQFLMDHISSGTCLMAIIDHEQQQQQQAVNERIVGVLISGPKHSNEAKLIFEEAAREGPTKWGHILQILGCIERDSNVYERFGVTNVLHVHALGVDQSVRGRGIGVRLMREEFELGRRCGFELVTADCTSLYSALLCERIGMECVNTVRYEEYVDAAGKQVFNPPAPHECVKTYAIRL